MVYFLANKYCPRYILILQITFLEDERNLTWISPNHVESLTFEHHAMGTWSPVVADKSYRSATRSRPSLARKREREREEENVM